MSIKKSWHYKKINEKFKITNFIAISKNSDRMFYYLNLKKTKKIYLEIEKIINDKFFWDTATLTNLLQCRNEIFTYQLKKYLMELNL